MEEKKRTDNSLHEKMSMLRLEISRLERQVKNLKRKLGKCIESNLRLLNVVSEHFNVFSNEEKDSISMACLITMPIGMEDFTLE